MERITWKEYAEQQEKGRKELEKIINNIHKRNGENVPYNFVTQALDSIEKCGEYCAQYGVTVKELKRKCEYTYICDTVEELKEVKENQEGYIIEENGLELVIKGYIISYIAKCSGVLGEVITSYEAANLIGVTEAAIRKAMSSGRLVLGRDYRKAGRITLIKKESVLNLKK